MTPQTAQLPGPAHPMRIRKRVVVPALLLLLLLGAMLRTVARGTLAGPATPAPTSATDGVRCGLIAAQDGSRPVSCALVIDRSLEQVLGVVTDYQHYTDIFPYLSALSASKGPDGRERLSGVAAAPFLHAWPFELVLSHTQSAAQHVISWDEPGGKLLRNSGRWELRRLDGAHTLVAYTLDIAVAHYPGFIVRDVLLNRMPAVLLAVQRRLGA